MKYHYDALGRRIARTVGTTRTYWFYDGWENYERQKLSEIHLRPADAPRHGCQHQQSEQDLPFPGVEEPLNPKP